MTSEVEICNMALSQLRAGSINSLNESSLQAQQCKLWYPICRDQVLEDAPWQFAHSIKPLALLTTEIFNWSYVYQYPTDCHKINYLIPNYELFTGQEDPIYFYGYDLYRGFPDLKAPIEYKIYNIENNRVIAANVSDLRIDYRMKIENPNLFSNQFVMALSHLIASKIAIAVVGYKDGQSMKKDNLSEYRAHLAEALANDFNEQYTNQIDSEFITARE